MEIHSLVGPVISWNQLSGCERCDLHANQAPLLDAVESAPADVFWVGISAKLTQEEDEGPLSNSTKTGALIASIESEYQSTRFYKTNLVKCVPLEEDGIRYPYSKEILACSANFVFELESLSPKVVFLLGKLVAVEVLMKFELVTSASQVEWYKQYPYDASSTVFVPIHHPSFVSIYRRKKIEGYRRQVGEFITP